MKRPFRNQKNDTDIEAACYSIKRFFRLGKIIEGVLFQLLGNARYDEYLRLNGFKEYFKTNSIKGALARETTTNLL